MKVDAGAKISNFSCQLHQMLNEMTEFVTLPLRMQNVLYGFSHTGTVTPHFIEAEQGFTRRRSFKRLVKTAQGSTILTKRIAMT